MINNKYNTITPGKLANIVLNVERLNIFTQDRGKVKCTPLCIQRCIEALTTAMI